MSDSLVGRLRIRTLGLLGLGILLALYATLRIRWRFLEGATDRSSENFVFNKSAKVLAFWHGRQLIIPLVYWSHRCSIKSTINALISLHSDGRLIAFIVGLLGVRNVAGSSSRGGKEATLTLIERLKVGESVALTPDGPKGPINKSKPGILKIASVTDTPIYPLSYSASRYWQFRSWDKMILPKPFSKVEIVVGRPMRVREELNDESVARLLAEVDSRLSEAEQEADSTWG